MFPFWCIFHDPAGPPKTIKATAPCFLSVSCLSCQLSYINSELRNFKIPLLLRKSPLHTLAC